MSVAIDFPRDEADVARFFSKIAPGRIDFVACDCCWEWQGFRMKLGYGQFGHLTDGRHRMLYAHRVSYTWFKEPIPDGLTIDHLCRNTRCVNPDHLEAVSSAENIRRAGAAITHCKYDHEFTPENTYRSKATGRRECKACNARRGRELRARRREQ